MNTPDTEEWIGKIVEKVRYVEFLHGVPVELPSRTKELLRSGIREAITSRDTYWKERVRKEVEGMASKTVWNVEGKPHISAPDLLQALDNLK